MNHSIRLMLPLVLCATACRSTVDTNTTLGQIVETRQAATLHVRERGEPRALMSIGQRTFAADATLEEWNEVTYTDFGALPATAFDDRDVLVMTGDVVVGGSNREPEVVHVSRLWRIDEAGRNEMVFETTDLVLGSFVSLHDGHCLAIRRDLAAPQGRHYGTALLRLADGSIGNLPLSGFDEAPVLLIDPAENLPVVLGQRRTGEAVEWGLFRLEGVERRPKLWEARVVAPAFAPDGRLLAYAWQADREAARRGREMSEGTHELLTVIDRETGAGRHIDTGIDVVATAFDPRDASLLYALGRSLAGDDAEWELLVIELEGERLRVISRAPFPPRSTDAAWRKRLPG